MKRRAFKVLVGLSLALFVATAMLWVRSYRLSDKWEWGDENAGHRVFSQEGRLGWIELKHSVINSGLFIGSRLQPGKWDHEYFGFSYLALRRPYYFWSIRIPYWFLLVLFVIPSVLWLFTQKYFADGFVPLIDRHIHGN